MILECSLVWGRAQPEDTTQMRCQGAIITGDRPCPRAKAVAPHWGLEQRLSTLERSAPELHRLGPGARRCLPSLDHSTQYGKLISETGQLGPASVPSKLLQDELFLSRSS